MPFKDPERARAWDRAHHQRYLREANQARTSAEDKIIKRVRDKPGYHDALSLYASLRRDRLPVTTIVRTVEELIVSGVLTWGAGQRGESGLSTPRLVLTNRAREIFTRPSRVVPRKARLVG